MKHTGLYVILVLSLYAGCVPPGESSQDIFTWTRLNTAPVSSTNIVSPILRIQDGSFYLAYGDEGQGQQLCVSHFDGTNWNNFGQSPVSAETAGYVSFRFNSAGTAFVTYREGLTPGPVTTQKLSGLFWSTFGTDCATPGAALHISMDIFTNDYPVYSYSDVQSNYFCSVRYYDQPSDIWRFLGPRGFTTNSITSTSCRVIGDRVYVACQYNTTRTAVVYNWTGMTWEGLGDPLANGSFSPRLQLLEYQGRPLLIQVENDSQLRAYHWNGSAWTGMGNSLIFSTTPDSLSVYGSGDPVLLYSDPSRGQAATARLWSDGEWILLGSPGFSTGPVSFSSLEAGSSGRLYAALSVSNQLELWKGEIIRSE